MDFLWTMGIFQLAMLVCQRVNWITKHDRVFGVKMLTFRLQGKLLWRRWPTAFGRGCWGLDVASWKVCGASTTGSAKSFPGPWLDSESEMQIQIFFRFHLFWATFIICPWDARRFQAHHLHRLGLWNQMEVSYNGGFPQQTHGFFLLKMTILGCEMGVPLSLETPKLSHAPTQLK